LSGFRFLIRSNQISERSNSPKELSFGWQGANLLGAFFNGAFLLALGVSIFLQSIERFVAIQSTHPEPMAQSHVTTTELNQDLVVENPELVLIIGCVGLVLNLISAAFLRGKFLCHVEPP
jgi:zinc transporter 1